MKFGSPVSASIFDEGVSGVEGDETAGGAAEYAAWEIAAGIAEWPAGADAAALRVAAGRAVREVFERAWARGKNAPSYSKAQRTRVGRYTHAVSIIGLEGSQVRFGHPWERQGNRRRQSQIGAKPRESEFDSQWRGRNGSHNINSAHSFPWPQTHARRKTRFRNFVRLSWPRGTSRSARLARPQESASMAPIAGYRQPFLGTQPNYLYPPYRSSIKRAPAKPLVYLPHTLSEITGPSFEKEIIDVKACDLTKQHSAPPLGERIIVSGRVLDEDGRPVRNTLVEVWQANAAGRYRHKRDQHEAPLDPNFSGNGYTLTDSEGRYRFVTIKPGEYPWRNHVNAWRPAHIHFSIFGPAFATRLVTQMYFPGDPLLPFDPVFNGTADEMARNRLISTFDWESTMSEWALGYRFDIILSGREATPMER
jgi:protocatechuate 3,4-dioxygenase, beta subunit